MHELHEYKYTKVYIKENLKKKKFLSKNKTKSLVFRQYSPNPFWIKEKNKTQDCPLLYFECQQQIEKAF